MTPSALLSRPLSRQTLVPQTLAAEPLVRPPIGLRNRRLAWRTLFPAAAPSLLLLLFFWSTLFLTALAAPPLLDDADATHAQAAQAMLHSGDWVTLHVDGVRYLEKAPLPYWIAALSLRVFGETAFAIHLPLALAVLGLALLGYGWALRAFGPRTALYTGLFVLTSIGPFLFTRIFIPEALLSLLLASALYALHLALEPADSLAVPRRSFSGSLPAQPLPAQPRRAALLFWLATALAVLTKGLIAVVFLLGAAALYLAMTKSWLRWRALRPGLGMLLFLAVAAPWHILAGLRNTGGADGHGFFWFYFVNEHLLRFLGRRIPRDYNKLPTLLYWSLHLVWLFPWSFFAPAAAVLLWRKRGSLLSAGTAAQRTFLLLAGFSALVLLFFSLSTNQEYYTFPVYLPLLLLLAAAVTRAQAAFHDRPLARALGFGYAALALTGLALAAALACGLWSARGLPSTADIGAQLGHRGIGGYTLSLSHFFDLTGASFAALRLPAALALTVFAGGPSTAWLLHRRHREHNSVLVLAGSFGVFLVAAHLALVRFAPVLSSRAFADRILALENTGQIAPGTEVLLYGDQSFGSSLPFYLRRSVPLVEGRSTSMLFGSSFADASPAFLSSADLQAAWGRGARKLLFVPAERRDTVERLLGNHSVILLQSSGKELLTDRPLSPLQRTNIRK